MAELKPCPFCGSPAIYVYPRIVRPFMQQETHYQEMSAIRVASHKGYIECSRCGVRQKKPYSSIANAEKAWNRRNGGDSDG